MRRNCNAWRTGERVEKFRQLLAAFAAGEMTLSQMRAPIGLSPTSARAYRDVMLAYGVIELAGTRPAAVLWLQGERVYRLAANAAQVAAFIEAVRAGGSVRRTEDKPALPEGSGRRFHVGFADTRQALQVSQMPAFRDWAVAALFGPAPVAGACA